MNKGSFDLRCTAAAALLLLAPTLALAYIDPGDGAYMVQMLLTIAGAAVLYVRRPIRSLKAAWSWLSSRQKQPEELGPLNTDVAEQHISGTIPRSNVNSMDMNERL